MLFDSVLTSILALIAFIAVIIYKVSNSSKTYWQSLGIKCVPYKVLFTYIIYNVFKKETAKSFQKFIYDYFEDCSLGVIPTFTGVIILVKDPQVIEHILVKDFMTFVNHGFKIDMELNPLGKFLSNLENVEWKKLRTKLSPNFTEKKLKNMLEQLTDSSDKLVEYLSRFDKRQEEVEIKIASGKFALDFIACTTFGLKTNAFSEDESIYIKMMKSVLNPPFFRGLASSFAFFCPNMAKIFKIKLFPQNVEDFFISIVKDTYKYRKENNFKRNDLFQSLSDIRKNEMGDCDDGFIFDDEVMAANCFGFLIGGFETIAGTCSFLLYELALNSEIQSKTYEEILKITRKFNDELTYEALKEMSYLSKVLSETLRKYTPAFVLSRLSNKPYSVPNCSAVIPKGTHVIIPTYALHTDPKYFPNPDKFDPDRFSRGNNIRKGTYLPFGEGPRMCIASRLAQLQIKVVVAKILLNYKVYITPDLQHPLQFMPGTWNVKGGLRMKVGRR